jgi:hypothetical protein
LLECRILRLLTWEGIGIQLVFPGPEGVNYGVFRTRCGDWAGNWRPACLEKGCGSGVEKLYSSLKQALLSSHKPKLNELPAEHARRQLILSQWSTYLILELIVSVERA